jgi:hypothetical protein
MSHVSEISVMRWPQLHLFIQRIERFRTRNAFSDARRAQAARLLAQQAGPPLDSRDTIPRSGRKARLIVD